MESFWWEKHFSKFPNTQEIILETKNKKETQWSLYSWAFYQETAGKCVKEETGNFYWKQFYFLVCFTKQTNIFKLRLGVPFVWSWESLGHIYTFPGVLRWPSPPPKQYIQTGILNPPFILFNFAMSWFLKRRVCNAKASGQNPLILTSFDTEISKWNAQEV